MKKVNEMTKSEMRGLLLCVDQLARLVRKQCFLLKDAMCILSVQDPEVLAHWRCVTAQEDFDHINLDVMELCKGLRELRVLMGDLTYYDLACIREKVGVLIEEDEEDEEADEEELWEADEEENDDEEY